MRNPLRRAAFLLLLSSCAIGTWESERAEHPATITELSACRVTVLADEPLREELERALAQRGFTVVGHPPYRGDLLLRAERDGARLTSDYYFVDEVRGDADQIADALAESKRVAEFVRNSGTVEQRNIGK
jgi:sugar phosphate isomerase/epimerase